MRGEVITAATIRQAELEAVAGEVRAIQARWAMPVEPDIPEERWFATLELESVASVNDHLAFVFRDRFGQRWGWRWESAHLGEPDWRDILTISLTEDVDTGGWTPPDADEWVRWLVASPHAD